MRELLKRCVLQSITIGDPEEAPYALGVTGTALRSQEIARDVPGGVVFRFTQGWLSIPEELTLHVLGVGRDAAGRRTFTIDGEGRLHGPASNILFPRFE